MPTTKRKRFPLEIDDEPSIYMDEQEQEQLISCLKSQDEKLNAQSRIAFALLSVLPIFIYIFQTPSGFKFIAVIACSSLFATAFTIWADSSFSGGPLDKYLGLFNGLLSIVVFIGGYLSPLASKDLENAILWALPFIFYIIGQTVKYSFKEVERGVIGLEKLKYKYKGA